MSEQHFRGALASGGTVVGTSRGIDVHGPDGAILASFERDVISDVQREGQVVTVERHGDTIVTFTTASITDAVGLEQFVRDTILAPPAPFEPPAEPDQPAPEPESFPAAPPPTEPEPPAEPPLAFDAFDSEPETAEPPPPRPPIVSRPDAEDEFPPQRDIDLPPPSPTIAPPPSTFEQLDEEPEPVAPLPPPPAYPTRPQEEGLPPRYDAGPEPAVVEGEGGRPKWLWGCLGCLGLIVAALICAGVLLATGVIDPDDFDDDDDPTPTPFVIVVTPTPTEEAGGAEGEGSPTADEGDAGTATEGEDTAPTEDASGETPSGDVLPAGETAVVGSIEATYLGARIDTEGLLPPDEGREYVVLNFEMVNTSTEPVIVSSLLQFELLDESGESHDVELFADVETALDAEIPAGDTLNGEIAFDVPEDSGPYTITFEDLITLEEATWAVDDIER